MYFRILLYLIITFHQFIYQVGSEHKAIFAAICCLLAEYFYTRNKKIFYTIIFYRLLILIINTLIPLLLWDKVYHLSFLDYAVRYDIHYFKEEYLLTYQLYFLYAAVHINAIVYTAKSSLYHSILFF